MELKYFHYSHYIIAHKVRPSRQTAPISWFNVLISWFDVLISWFNVLISWFNVLISWFNVLITHYLHYIITHKVWPSRQTAPVSWFDVLVAQHKCFIQDKLRWQHFTHTYTLNSDYNYYGILRINAHSKGVDISFYICSFSFFLRKHQLAHLNYKKHYSQ